MNNALPCNLNLALYTNDINVLNKSSINNYDMPHIEPDALAYSKYFYAKHHIPGIQNRPGNNSYPSTDVYKQYLDNYNLQCHN